MQGTITENGKLLPATLPRDINGVVSTGDWVSVQQYRRVAILIVQGAWAGGTPAVTVNQATDKTGTGSKAVPLASFLRYTALTSDTPTRTTITGNTFNLPATANQVTILEVHSQDLDIDGGFCFLSVSVASPGANADLLSINYVVYDPRFAGDATRLPTAIE